MMGTWRRWTRTRAPATRRAARSRSTARWPTRTWPTASCSSGSTGNRGRRASFERALALNASHAAAHHDYAWSLVALGRDDEAVAHITAARDLDPLSTRANTDIGWLYLQLRQPAEATRACQHTLAIQPGALEAQACLERAYLQRGMYDAALRAAEATLPATGCGPAARGAGTSRDRLRAFWRWRLERLEEMARSRWISPYTLAVHLAMLGDTDRAVEQLERPTRSASA